jgi:uncharacterized repeat protein (TIGR01451 family)
MWMGAIMTNQSQHKVCGRADCRAASGSSGIERICAGRLSAFALVLIGLLMMMIGAHSATAKSLYVIAESLDLNQQVPVLACDIAPDGTLTLQAKQTIPQYGAGGEGLALDPGSQRLFVTYNSSNVIEVLSAVTLHSVGTVTAPGTNNLAGIVYDYDKDLLYCAARGSSKLYIYQWKPAFDELIPLPGSPFQLEGAKAYGIALDEITDELYVGGLDTSVNVYSTSDWHLVKTIPLSRVAMSVAVDPVKSYLYYGAGLADDWFLVRHDLIDDTEKEVQIGDFAGVVGLAVDSDTGFVYTSTGSATCYCGRDLLSFDSNLTLIGTMRGIAMIDNPGGVVVPSGHISYNPFRLTKTVKTSSGDLLSDTSLLPVAVGEELTYSICFDHNDLPLTEISVVDTLPAELTFVRATGDASYGQYNAQKRVYVWTNPPLSGGPKMCLELVCRVDPNLPAGQIITNSATIRTRERPPTTTEVDVVTVVPKVYKPLYVKKTVIAGTIGGGEVTLPSAYAGDEITYRIVFDNRDNIYPAKNVRLTDNLPPEVDFVRATGYYVATGRTCTWSYPELAVGDSYSVDVVVRLHDDVTAGTTITNAAAIVSDDTLVTRTSADIAVASYKPLGLQKTLADGAVGQPDSKGRSYVGAGSTITYTICFNNPVTNKAVTGVTIVDTLPREVTFVSADGDRSFGFYDDGKDKGTPTYTWRYTSLPADTEKCLKLVVRVKDGVAANTVISNSAMISTAQTPSTTTQLDVVVGPASDSPLRLQKTLVSGAVGQPDAQGRSYVDTGSLLTYRLCFSNPATNAAVAAVTVVDALPPQVSFVSADGDGSFGSYDAGGTTGTPTYTWRYAALAPGEEKCVNLVVRVNDKVDPDTVIVNAATINAGQVSSTTAQLAVVVRTASVMYVKPDHIYRNNSPAGANLMVVVHLPIGTGMGAISNTPLMLTLPDVVATGQRVLNPASIKATGQQIFGTSTQGKVLCFFNVAPILTATQGYGEFPLKVTGLLNDGRSFVADGTIWVLKSGGP